MNYTTKDNWHYKANEGYYFKREDSFSTEIYLGKFDSIDKWEIVTEEEKIAYETVKAEEEAKASEEVIVEE